MVTLDPIVYSDYRLKHEKPAMIKEIIEKINEIVNIMQLIQIEKHVSPEELERARKKGMVKEW